MTGASSPKVHRTADGVYENYLGGRWTAARSGGVYDNVDPAHPDRVLGRVPETSPDEVAEATTSAQRDFDEWRLIPGDFRTKFACELTRLLEANRELLIETVTREMGKSLFDSGLDVDEAIGVCEALAPQGANLKGETYQKLTRGLAMECRAAPRGVAAIITPFNFPIAIPLAQIVAALVTGNTVVWKPSHLVPESSQLLADLVLRALATRSALARIRVPGGIFHVIFGDAETGEALIRRPEVQTISFTGSKKVGDYVDSIASGLGKRVMKEVAGINMFYVHRDADIERAARNFVYGKTITSGQRCSSIQEVLLDPEVVDSFTRRVCELAPRIVYGPGASPEVTRADAEHDAWSCPPLASREQILRLERLVASSIAAGATTVFRGELPPGLGHGYYHPFTILTDVRRENPLWSEEAFGPVAVFTRVSGLAEAIDLINTKIGIVACIDSRSKSATENFIERVLRTRIDDGRHGTGCFWGTKFGGDRGAGSGNPALDEDMVKGYVIWKTIYRAYDEI
jgi:acyl-CoA reductase-like NAD-dependent aldehyde dehydrogenase